MGAVLPSGWEREPLGVFTKIASGCSPSQMGLADAGSYPFFKVEELNYSDKYLSRARAYYSKIGDSLQGKFLLLPKRGAAIFLNKLRIYEGTFQVDTNLMALGFDERKTFAEFMFYKLTTEGLDKIADTSSVPQINNKHIQPYIVDLPPLPEQKKIARILSTVDSKLALIDQQITATQTLKKGLMQKLFSEGVGTQDADGKWLPHTEFKDSELGRIPAGWEVAKLTTKCSTIKDGTHFSPKSKDGPFKYITSKNIKFGKMCLTDVAYISEDEHNTIFSGSPVKHGDVLLTKDGANTGNAAINSVEEEFSLLSSVAYLRGEVEKLENKFLLHLLLSPNSQQMIKSEMAGQAITRLTLKKISNFKFAFPPIEEQKEISKILSTADRKLDHLTTQKTQTEHLKKGLMQKLLTGQIRVKPDPQDHIQE